MFALATLISRVTLETILNLIWLLVAVAAWGLSRRQARRGAGQRLAVLLVVVCLFPCVSASDDLASFGVLGRQLQVLEFAQVATTFVLLLAWFFLALVVVSHSLRHSEMRPAPAGRSPPLSFSF